MSSHRRFSIRRDCKDALFHAPFDTRRSSESRAATAVSKIGKGETERRKERGRKGGKHIRTRGEIKNHEGVNCELGRDRYGFN